MNRRTSLFPIALLALLALGALALSIYNAQQVLPYQLWPEALRRPDTLDIRQVIFHYSTLPRLVIALLVGAGLALAGVLFQQVLRNPLAEPSTLGVASGAQLGVTVTTLWLLPGGEFTQQLAALLGALAIGALVFGVAWGKRMSPVTLILAGLVLSLYCSAVNNLLALFHYQQLENLFLWSSGALNQQDWHRVRFLLPRLGLGLLLALLLIRPMTLLGVDDSVARNLGLGLSTARLGALALAIVLSALLVNAVGVVGFIGLFAPLLAKLLGARRLLHRLLLAPLIGALLLWFTDQVMVWLSQVWRDVPTGAATALVGAPILLWLLPRLRHAVEPSAPGNESAPRPERARPAVWTGVGLLLLLAGACVALMLGRNSLGWSWAGGDELLRLLPWRWPRTLAALSAGVMLAAAGTLIQKLTANPMGSPEVLGISAGAASAVVLMMFLIPGDVFIWLLPAGSLGAALTLAAILLVAGLRHFSTQRMLLAGIALGTAFTTMVTLLLASGDPRLGGLLTWISGSTYAVRAPQAITSAMTALVLLLLVPWCRRWLNVLPLGGATARALGLPLARARAVILLLAAVLTAGATLAVGPLSFIGLMAPHMARMLGFRRAMPQLVMAAVVGAMLMLLADWSGRMVMFPNQIPAGLLATFIGAPYFIFLLRRQGR
ncbi:Fe(3+)-hydroxamate ABC transporter permease FhuB [Acerihabitans arboris]|uniref:Fe(3+)-hydroxamate ABC transporter permease FhuB n=1 Tax=Acerihabitans arboris TaxID=2691583 RepID=A0A845SCV5_9GAMM|nr:Fe(3+)-hydroxamate ABC transporter permease FhuB [Acerihabitans arboris]NDL61237.1 Fe(3+)-hydroxamate ABC transporter permease FhuB [Acerihabitans arboris]